MNISALAKRCAFDSGQAAIKRALAMADDRSFGVASNVGNCVRAIRSSKFDGPIIAIFLPGMDDYQASSSISQTGANAPDPLDVSLLTRTHHLPVGKWWRSSAWTPASNPKSQGLTR
jgi:hypothetical protein